jgi:hypothetical protein
MEFEFEPLLADEGVALGVVTCSEGEADEAISIFVDGDCGSSHGSGGATCSEGN